MKKNIIFLLVFILLLCSCSRKQETDFDYYDSEIYISSSFGINELIKDVESVDLYIVHERIVHWGSHSSIVEYELEEAKLKKFIDDENKFREICDYSIHLKDTPMFYMLIALSNAKRTDKDPKHVSKKITSDKHGKIKGVQGGAIIDIHLKNGNTKTLIMQNDGCHMVYEKDKEDEHYKMPKLLLEKFHLGFSETTKSTGIFVLPFPIPF